MEPGAVVGDEPALCPRDEELAHSPALLSSHRDWLDWWDRPSSGAGWRSASRAPVVAVIVLRMEPSLPVKRAEARFLTPLDRRASFARPPFQFTTALVRGPVGE
jgi:hypothetical protein